MGTLTERTSSIWTRSFHAFLGILPSSWRGSRIPGISRYDSTAIGDEDDDGGLYDDEEGEGLVGLDIDDLSRDALTLGAHGLDTQDRLSRDLEEGFRDDSDDEASEAHSEGRHQR